MNIVKKLFLLAGVAVAVVLILWIYYILKPVPATGFTRNLRRGIVHEIATAQLPDYSYYIASASQDALCLGNYRLTDHILTVDTGFQKQRLTLLRFPVPLVWDDLQLSVLGHQLTLADRITKMIISLDMRQKKFFDVRKSRPKFLSCYPMDEEHYALRINDTANRQFQLARYNVNGHQISKSGLLTKQGDGYFSTDGMFIRAGGNRWLYVYFYRNQVLIVDSLLNLQSTIRTVDTFSCNPNRIGQVNYGTEATFSNPTIYVNHRCTVFRNFLLIQSGVKADNQGAREFSKNATIDVYSLHDGRYRFSFYIPFQDHIEVTSIAADDNFIYATFNDRALMKFELKIKSFS